MPIDFLLGEISEMPCLQSKLWSCSFTPGDKLVQSPSEIHQATRQQVKDESQGNGASTSAEVKVCRTSPLPASDPTHSQTHIFPLFFPHFSPLAYDLSCCTSLLVPNCDPREELCEHGEFFFLSCEYLLVYYKWSYFRQTSSHFGWFSLCAGVTSTLLICLLIREKFQTFVSFVNWPTPSCTQAAHAFSPSGTTQKFLGGRERMGENPAAR